MLFSDEIKKLRKKLLLSQTAFAQEIGVSYTTVNRWEMGRAKPSYKTLKAIDEYCRKNNIEFDRGTFRTKGDNVDIIPTYEKNEGIRISFFDDEIEKIGVEKIKKAIDMRSVWDEQNINNMVNKPIQCTVATTNN